MCDKSVSLIKKSKKGKKRSRNVDPKLPKAKSAKKRKKVDPALQLPTDVELKKLPTFDSNGDLLPEITMETAVHMVYLVVFVPFGSTMSATCFTHYDPTSGDAYGVEIDSKSVKPKRIKISDFYNPGGKVLFGYQRCLEQERDMPQPLREFAKGVDWIEKSVIEHFVSKNTTQ
jgi:hypothetical protein